MKDRRKIKALAPEDIDRIIEMAWEDRTPFDAILVQFGLKEEEVIQVMKRSLKPSSWKRWRERAKKVSIKHAKKRPMEVDRFHSKAQRTITSNKISKKKY